MKNLKPYKECTSTFLDDVLKAKNNHKKDPDYKDRVEILKPNIKIRYSTFDAQHTANNLVSLIAHGYLGQDKIDLLKLYKYDNSVIQKLNEKVTTLEGNRLINTCQNCTINEINSLDHIVPKDEFPEFSVNPRNLFPSCSKCNGHKSYVWRENNKSVFLNLYIDNLPEEQYLFCNPTFDGDKITLKFTVENKFDIEQNLFDLIYNHYTRLHLPKRFRKNSHDTIYELSKEINKYTSKISKDELIKTIKEDIIEDKRYYGFNYWKAIIKETLINDEQYLDLMFR
ncbi:MAG: HNH endonuclease [Flavobacterium sp.]